jgi:glycosyltransferase involved in cell wall biosynthesis
MKVTGFSFIKNAVKFDFPIQEALLSILPLCDEIIVAVGDCTDGTRELVQAIHPTKIKIIDTVWNPNLNRDGIVLADETNKALQAAFATDSDWLIYIQGDEVLHENGYTALQQAMQQYKDDERVDGLLLHYHHFYGSYDYIATSSHWYKNEIRIIKNNNRIYSYKDAQGFRKGNNKKLQVKAVDAYMHHYGWVKDPHAMQEKQLHFNKYWHDDEWVERNVVPGDTFDYGNVRFLERFTGTHPQYMQARIASRNWSFNFDISVNRLTVKEKCKKFLLQYMGWDTGHKNYRVLR